MDNQPKCFVPDCNNEVGVVFPKNLIVKKKWLKSLGLEHLNSKIDSKSFVCLDHFEDDVGQPGAVPRSNASTSAVALPENVPEKHNSVETKAQTTRTFSYQDIRKKIDTSVLIQNLKREITIRRQGKPRKISDSVSTFKTGTVYIKQDHQDYEEHTSFDNMCRLCMSQPSQLMQNVYSKVDEKHTIAHMINVCLHPVQISPRDKLSKYICSKCLQKLKDHFKFHQYCLGMDAKQRELLLVEQGYGSEGHYADSENSEEYLHEERLSDFENDRKNRDESRNEKTNGHIFKRPSTDQENQITIKSIQKKSEIDLKFDKVEEELARVLEGNVEGTEFATANNLSQSKSLLELKETKVPQKSIVSVDKFIKSKDPYKSQTIVNKFLPVQEKEKDDDIYTEDIIIEMINDEEPETPPPTSSIKLPITIKRLSSVSSKTPPAKKKRNNSNSFDNSNRNITMIKSSNSQQVVVLPKGITVEVKEKYKSPLGTFSSQPIKYLFNSEFLLADGYLYEYWLAKTDIRNLHCIVPRCPATATQSRLDRNTFDKEIQVTKSHDHEPPDELERKRQMFYSIMYSKMRRDRNFNFKLLYEQFCQLDSDLKEILPLRKVVSEICKQGPITQPPTMNSFDQFFNSIESDVFHKFHFTDSHVQFYQDRFESEDGSKAVIFANTQVIESYSYSKLMYVDASFHIDSNDFPFKLITVLVWVHESYYPIFYAFVNQKSLEIYRQIFNFLYNYLAPNLRPEEIITDYEAHLYYALGETYVESSIGGSMFYFTQNLYKKICDLNLATELDLNSNFKSVFNMLIMLPLLPVNTILDGLNNVEVQAKELGLEDLTNELFIHVHNQWMCNVTPEFFCVHRLENRINENIVAPFKKLRDLIMLARKKTPKNQQGLISTVQIIEKILELERFLRETYNGPGKKTFAKDLSSSQKKIVLKAWNFIENHPKININHFFLKVLGYIKCLENQLWIWGFYRYEGDTNDELINANNFSIVNEDNNEEACEEPAEEMLIKEEDIQGRQEEEQEDDVIEEFYIEEGGEVRRVVDSTSNSVLLEEFSDEHQSAHSKVEIQPKKEQPAIVMEAVIDENGSFVLKNKTDTTTPSSEDSNFFVYK